MSEKYRITVDLEPDEYQKLKQLKNINDRSLAWLGRQAICEYINKNSIAQHESSQQFRAGAHKVESMTG